MEHTKGPWIVEKSESSSTGSVHYAVKTAYNPPEHDWSPRFITFMCGGLGDFHPSRKISDYRSDPQIEADVTLIAAAPEILAALKDQRELMVGYESRLECDGAYVAARQVSDRIEMVTAVIAKAEGR